MKSKILFMTFLVCALIATSCGKKKSAFTEPHQRETESTIVSKEKPTAESKARPDAEIQLVQGPKLRSAFLSKDTNKDYAGIIGRLAILLENKTVPVETIFHVGDKIKFEVTSNRDGWIYIFHRPPKGELSLIWPDKDVPVSKNFITQHQPTVVPSKASIKFDDKIGNETFYIAIVPEPKAPPIGAEKSKLHLPISETDGPVVRKQIAVRGIEQLSKRGVKLRPDDGDIYLYFSIETGDDEDVAAIAFQLRHE